MAPVSGPSSSCMTTRAHEQLTGPSVSGAKGDILLASEGVEVLVRVELDAGRGGRKGGKEGDEGGEGEHLGGGKGGGVGWRGKREEGCRRES